MNRLQSFPLLLLLFSFSSCIEFEREKLTYIHDEEKDEIRMTLTYEGIVGNLDKGQNSQNGPDDITTKDNLNQKQIEQLESVLTQKRAFFFSNWIFEYNQNSLKQILEKEENELATEGRVFGKPEKENAFSKCSANRAASRASRASTSATTYRRTHSSSPCVRTHKHRQTRTGLIV